MPHPCRDSDMDATFMSLAESQGAGGLVSGVSRVSGATWRGSRGRRDGESPPQRVLGRALAVRERLGGSGGYGEEAGAGGLEGGDVVDVTQGQADVVEAFHEPPAGVVVDLERRLDPGRLGQHDAVVEVDHDLGGRVGLDGVLERGHGGLGQDDGQQAGLGGVAAEDVTEPRGDHGPEAVVGQGPDRVLAGRAGAEVGAGDQDGRAVVLRLVEHEGRVLAPGGEQALAEAGPAHLLEVLGRDDLVGVHVAAAQRHGAAGVGDARLHGSGSLDGSAGYRSAGAARWPVTAVAAATSGETRWVRPPLPWRPSKLRLDVDALRSPEVSLSGFMPRHIEQPAERHSAPAALNTASRPSASAWARTAIEPGTTSIRTDDAIRRPWSTDAAARRSSIRPLVQEPTKTVSTATSRSAVPGLRSM